MNVKLFHILESEPRDEKIQNEQNRCAGNDIQIAKPKGEISKMQKNGDKNKRALRTMRTKPTFAHATAPAFRVCHSCSWRATAYTPQIVNNALNSTNWN